MKRGGGLNVIRGEVDGVVEVREGVVPPDIDYYQDMYQLWKSSTR